ncbi:hypothetical protein ElyMa_006945800 [Elysia marginata]|uniref:Uncharacterized protein n=1 Tax=Elysia marginata TaxID=1093978 RepID=A0AAV4JIS9_9GAST|nr:hypothetical protein ElyMa_006945800 [Elysia marginata]
MLMILIAANFSEPISRSSHIMGKKQDRKKVTLKPQRSRPDNFRASLPVWQECHACRTDTRVTSPFVDTSVGTAVLADRTFIHICK